MKRSFVRQFNTVVTFDALLFRLAGDQRARRDSRHDSDAEDDDDVKKVRKLSLTLQILS